MKKLLLVLVTLFVAGCEDTRCPETGTDSIASVGGCDSTGLCGVRTLSGHITTHKYPVVGQEITFKNQVECKK